MNELIAIGVSHKTAPVALRERLAFSEAHAIGFARLLVSGQPARDAVSEAVVISTCNRTELYLVSADPLRAEVEALGMLARRARIRPTELAEVIYSPRNCDAARQLFRVTAGLEAMIVGEAEIQGQVRRAYESAREASLTGPLLDRLFAAALTAGRLVRSRTAIGHSRVSVPAAAVDLASEMLGSLARRRVIVLGAGETSELTAQALARQGAGTVFVANRHADRARSIAARFGGAVVSLDDLPDQLADADIVLASTSSPHHIVGAEELDVVMERRRERPLLLIDMAVPRDIDPRCGELAGVSLYDIDDLHEVVARNIRGRSQEVPQAEEIIEDEIRRFARWLGEAETLPTVAALREHASALVAAIIADNEGRWESASAADIARAETIARAVASRLLHEPTTRLRRLSGARRHAMLELVRELFGLATESDGEASRAPADAVDDLVRSELALTEMPLDRDAQRALQGGVAEGALGGGAGGADGAGAPLATVHSLQARRRR
jgi:glutamyl-tRNA reductase